MSPTLDRRCLLRCAGTASLALLGVTAAHAQARLPALAFEDVLAALNGEPSSASSALSLELSGIAENGALVPVSVSSALNSTRELLIFVDVNPQPLALHFMVPEGTEPFVATRIRMAGSGTVYAAARTAGGSLHVVARQVQVSIGGCG